MTRDELYDHATLDRVMAVNDYVELALHGDVKIEMSETSLLLLQNLLVTLQIDIAKRLYPNGTTPC